MNECNSFTSTLAHSIIISPVVLYLYWKSSVSFVSLKYCSFNESISSDWRRHERHDRNTVKSSHFGIVCLFVFSLLYRKFTIEIQTRSLLGNRFALRIMRFNWNRAKHQMLTATKQKQKSNTTDNTRESIWRFSHWAMAAPNCHFILFSRAQNKMFDLRCASWASDQSWDSFRVVKYSVVWVGRSLLRNGRASFDVVSAKNSVWNELRTHHIRTASLRYVVSCEALNRWNRWNCDRKMCRSTVARCCAHEDVGPICLCGRTNDRKVGKCTAENA